MQSFMKILIHIIHKKIPHLIIHHYPHSFQKQNLLTQSPHTTSERPPEHYILSSEQTTQPQIRKSNKQITRPQWLNDYTAKVTEEKLILSPPIDTSLYPSCTFFFDSTAFNHKHINFMAALSIVTKPRSYFEARQNSN